MPTVRLTREQLYDQVWSQPIQRLAQQFGLSDVGLAKLCRRHQVPIPGRGYWRRQQTGYKVRQTPLPTTADSSLTAIIIDRPTPKPLPDVTAGLHPLIAFERQPENRIIVDNDIEATHPLIRATRQYWAARRRGDGGAAGQPRLAIEVSSDALPRALRTMQALLVACERRGFEVAATTSGESTVRILEQPVRFALEERTQQVLHERTTAEQAAAKRGVPIRRWDHVPNGRLALKIQRHWSVGRRVADCAQQAIEERLNEFIERLVEQALVQQAEAAEAARKERERQEAERQRKEAEAQRREEEARIAGFDHFVGACKRTADRRACLATLRDAVGPVEPDSELGQWLEWAQEYTERNDPAQRVMDREATICLHYNGGFEGDRVLSKGFEEPEETRSYGKDPEPPGILVSDCEWLVGYGRKDIEIEVPEDAVLPFELSEDGHWARMFRVPARVLNRYLPRKPEP